MRLMRCMDIRLKKFKQYLVVLSICMVVGLFTGCSEKAEDVFSQSDVSGNGSAIAEDDNSADGKQVVQGEPITSNGNVSGNDGTAENGKDHVDGSLNEGATDGQDGTDAGAENASGIPEREAVKVKGIYVSGPIAGHSKMEDLIALVDETELNSMVIDIKNDEGKITYKMQTETVLEIDAGVNYIRDIDELVKKCKEKDIYLIARIVAFRDPYLAEQKPELAVKTATGEVFRDKNGLAWVNPYKKEVWDYLMEVATEAANVGFDEIQFDYIRFSTDIKAGEADFGAEAERVSKIDIITQFTEYAYETLTPLGVFVAADVFGTVIDNETDQKIVGQDYAKMAEHLDYICPMVYPSHYVNGAYGISVPDAEPYRTINEASSSSVEVLGKVPEENRATVRVWLQSFTAKWVSGYISYGPQQIREQIKGAYDAGYEEWILWNAAVNYQRDSLLTDEEAEAERQQWDAQRAAEAERVQRDAKKATEAMETVSGNN